MKARPIGQVVGHGKRANTIIEIAIGIQDPETGSRMHLHQDLSELSAEQLQELQDIVQDGADSIADVISSRLQAMLDANRGLPVISEQLPLIQEEDEDKLEIPGFLRRQPT